MSKRNISCQKLNFRRFFFGCVVFSINAIKKFEKAVGIQKPIDLNLFNSLPELETSFSIRLRLLIRNHKNNQINDFGRSYYHGNFHMLTSSAKQSVSLFCSSSRDLFICFLIATYSTRAI